MPEVNEQGGETAGREFVITREFDAPREMVFQAWTEPDRLAQWMSPKGFATISTNLDFRAGGTYHYGLRAPNGTDMWGKWTFREIVRPQKLVFTSTFSDEHGGLTRHPFSATWPMEMLTTVLFEETNGKTTLTLRWAPINANAIERETFDAALDGMNQGWGGTLDQLSAYLAKQ